MLCRFNIGLTTSLLEEEDKQAFLNRNTIGKHILFSCLADTTVGFFSWDDRLYPVGIIGQNCILPQCQGNGYGTNQVNEIITIFKDLHFKKIKVTTGDHPFFISSVKMYEKCGFRISDIKNGELFSIN